MENIINSLDDCKLAQDIKTGIAEMAAHPEQVTDKQREEMITRMELLSMFL